MFSIAQGTNSMYKTVTVSPHAHPRFESTWFCNKKILFVSFSKTADGLYCQQRMKPALVIVPFYNKTIKNISQLMVFNK